MSRTTSKYEGNQNFIIGCPGSGVVFCTKSRAYEDLERGYKVIVIDPNGGFMNMKKNLSNSSQYAALAENLEVISLNGVSMYDALSNVPEHMDDGLKNVLYVDVAEPLFDCDDISVSLGLIESLKKQGLDITISLQDLEQMLSDEGSRSMLKMAKEIILLRVAAFDRRLLSVLLDIPYSVLENGNYGVIRTQHSVWKRKKINKEELGEELYSCFVDKPAC